MLAPGRSEKMPASDERSRHGNVLDDVLREEIKDLTPEQVKRVLGVHRNAETAVTSTDGADRPSLGACPFVIRAGI